MSSCEYADNEDEDISLMAHSSDPSLYSACTPPSPNSSLTNRVENASENLLAVGDVHSSDACYEYGDIDDALSNTDLALVLGLPEVTLQTLQHQPHEVIDVVVDDDDDDDDCSGAPPASSMIQSTVCDDTLFGSIVLPPGITLVKIPMKPHNRVDQRQPVETPVVCSNSGGAQQQPVDVLKITKVLPVHIKPHPQPIVQLITQEHERRDGGHIECTSLLSPGGAIQSTSNLVDQARKMCCPNFELKSIEIKMNTIPDAVASVLPIGQQPDNTDNHNTTSSKRALAFSRLQQALRKQLPFIASRPVIARKDNVHSVTFDCTILSTSNAQSGMKRPATCSWPDQTPTAEALMTPVTAFPTEMTRSGSSSSRHPFAKSTRNKDHVPCTTSSASIISPHAQFATGLYSDPNSMQNMLLLFRDDTKSRPTCSPAVPTLDINANAVAAAAVNQFNDVIACNEHRPPTASAPFHSVAKCSATVQLPNKMKVPDQAETVDEIVAFLNDFKGESPVIDSLNAAPLDNANHPTDKRLWRDAHSSATGSDIIIDVETVDVRNERSNMQMFPTSRSILKHQSIGLKLMTTLQPIASNYTTVETPSAVSRQATSRVVLTPYRHFFQTDALQVSNKQRRSKQTMHAWRNRKLSSYARQLLKRRTLAIKSAGATFIAVDDDGALQPKMMHGADDNQFDEIDIRIRFESTEFSLESLDEIPIDQIFVPDAGFDINDYL